MKTLAIATLFLSSVFAFPQAPEFQNGTDTDNANLVLRYCTPVSYQCRQNADRSWGWDVCDVDGTWKNGGNCAPTDICVFNQINNSP